MHDGVTHSCEFCYYKVTNKRDLLRHAKLKIVVSFVTIRWLRKDNFNSIWSLSAKELNIVVNSVTIRYLRKATINNIWCLSMIELNIVVSFVNIRQIGKATFNNNLNLYMKELNIVVSLVTIRPLGEVAFNTNIMWSLSMKELNKINRYILSLHGEYKETFQTPHT